MLNTVGKTKAHLTEFFMSVAVTGLPRAWSAHWVNSGKHRPLKNERLNFSTLQRQSSFSPDVRSMRYQITLFCDKICHHPAHSPFDGASFSIPSTTELFSLDLWKDSTVDSNHLSCFPIVNEGANWLGFFFLNVLNVWIQKPRYSAYCVALRTLSAICSYPCRFTFDIQGKKNLSCLD